MADALTPFVLSDDLDAQVWRAAEMITDARHVVALTGAGLSVESGIPPFRGPGGLWTRYGEPPLDGYQRFLADPAQAWRDRLNPTQPWLVALRDTLAEAKPNAAHRAFAELERLGQLAALITQNVDDLHGQAGSQTLLEIHGNHHKLRCTGCVARFAPDDVPIDPDDLPPHCPACGGIVKDDTVHFGEPIPPDVLRRCYEEVERADLMIVAGTSATVYPAAEFPVEVLRRGGRMIEVNPDPTDLSDYATLSLRGPGGALLERLLHHVAERTAEGRA